MATRPPIVLLCSRSIDGDATADRDPTFLDRSSAPIATPHSSLTSTRSFAERPSSTLESSSAVCAAKSRRK
jgi:hypothetical protein